MITAGLKIVSAAEKDHQEERYLALGLKCDGLWGSTYWACFAHADLRLLPVNKNQGPISMGKRLNLLMVIQCTLFPSLAIDQQKDKFYSRSVPWRQML